MTRYRTRRGWLAWLGAAAATSALPAFAQAYPSRPITLIVPFPAGGPTDRHLRTLAEILGAQLGQPVIVENRPGAAGTLGPASMAASAKPDGYTLSQFPAGMLRLPHMQHVAWDPLADFTFIAGLSGYNHGLVVNAASPFKTVNDYLEAARAQPGGVDYGSAGIGTNGHVLMRELATVTGVRLTHVPFKGNPDMMQALLGGHVMAACDAAGWDKLVDAGQVRLLMTFGAQPPKRWPRTPTAQSLGFGIVNNSPYGIVGPRGMDPAIVKLLQDALRKATFDPRNLAMLEQLSQEPWFMPADAYREWAVQAFAQEKVMLERLGLAEKR